MLAYIKTPTHLSLNIGGHARLLANDHINYKAVCDAIAEYDVLTDGYDGSAHLQKILAMCDVSQFVTLKSDGRVSIGEEGVLLDGMAVHSTIAKRIVQFFQAGENVAPLCRFLERLSKNPNKDIAKDIYDWVETGALPIVSDGRFVAYKKVKEDYTSIHGTHKGVPLVHHVGNVLEIPPEDCDSDRYNTCSNGLHFCSYSYLPNFGWGGGNRVVVLAICPSEVGAIPQEYALTKGRAWKYEVIGEVPEEEAEHFFKDRNVWTPAYTGDKEDFDTDLDDEDYDEDYDEEIDDEDEEDEAEEIDEEDEDDGLPTIDDILGEEAREQNERAAATLAAPYIEVIDPIPGFEYYAEGAVGQSVDEEINRAVDDELDGYVRPSDTADALRATFGLPPRE